MHDLRPTPVIYMAVAMTLGIIIADSLRPTLEVIAIIGAALVIAAASLRVLLNSAGVRRVAIICSLYVVLGAAVWQVEAAPVQSSELARLGSGSELDVVAAVIGEPRSREGREEGRREWRVLARISDGPHAGERIRAAFDLPVELEGPRWGELWQLSGRSELAADVDDAGYRGYLFHKRVAVTLKGYEGGGVKVASSAGGLFGLVQPIRIVADEEARKYLPDDARALLLGITLGDGSRLTDEMIESFRITGLSHLVVASGMNVAVVVVVVVLPLMLLAAPRWSRALLGSTAAAGYVLCAGAQPSVLRAGVMAVMALVLSLAYRKASLVSAIAASAILILTLDPFALFDLSFQLSYAATLGLAIALPLVQRSTAWILERLPLLRKIPGVLLEAAQVSLAAQITVMPVILHNFGTLAPYTLPANIAAVPIATVVLVGGLIAPLLSQIGGPVGIVAYAPLYGALEYLIAVAEFFAARPAAGYAMAPLTVIQTVALAGVIALLLGAAARPKEAKRVLVRLAFPATCLLMIAAIALSGLSFMRSSPTEKLSVTFLDVGQGDAALAQLPTGESILFDTGEPGQGLLAKLRKRGVARLDLIVLSHLQSDHAGEAPVLIESMPVGALVVPAVAIEEAAAPTERDGRPSLSSTVLRAAAKRGVRVAAGDAGDRLMIGGARIELLYPRPPETEKVALSGDQANLQSVVARLVFGEVGFLLTGDLEAPGKRDLLRLLNSGDIPSTISLRSQVLKVAHHGSRDSVDPEFLSAVSPQLSVLSVGCRNGYGHPHPEAMAALAEGGGSVLRTDEYGDITVESDGKQVELDRSLVRSECRKGR